MCPKSNSNAENDLNDIEMAPLMETDVKMAPLVDQASTSKSLKDIISSSWSVLTAVGMYTFCSVGMVLVNKSLASR